MKERAKLIKHEVDYYCLLNNKGEVIADVNGGDIDKLSLKNCQAIERWYDLDELAEDYLTLFPEKTSDPDRNFVRMGMEEGFKAGFQKALEILGDRRFTEEEAHKIWKAGQEYWKTSGESITFEELIERRSELLQQNEWEVEVEMTLAKEYYGYVKKLDADGCLILKRVV